VYTPDELRESRALPTAPPEIVQLDAEIMQGVQLSPKRTQRPAETVAAAMETMAQEIDDQHWEQNHAVPIVESNSPPPHSNLQQLHGVGGVLVSQLAKEGIRSQAELRAALTSPPPPACISDHKHFALLRQMATLEETLYHVMMADDEINRPARCVRYLMGHNKTWTEEQAHEVFTDAFMEACGDSPPHEASNRCRLMAQVCAALVEEQR
jgi:predicted flap endonuclease-1-like 5' DNA nuclease